MADPVPGIRYNQGGGWSLTSKKRRPCRRAFVRMGTASVMPPRPRTWRRSWTRSWNTPRSWASRWRPPRFTFRRSHRCSSLSAYGARSGVQYSVFEALLFLFGRGSLVRLEDAVFLQPFRVTGDRARGSPGGRRQQNTWRFDLDGRAAVCWYVDTYPRGDLIGPGGYAF